MDALTYAARWMMGVDNPEPTSAVLQAEVLLPSYDMYLKAVRRAETNPAWEYLSEHRVDEFHTTEGMVQRLTSGTGTCVRKAPPPVVVASGEDVIPKAGRRVYMRVLAPGTHPPATHHRPRVTPVSYTRLVRRKIRYYRRKEWALALEVTNNTLAENTRSSEFSPSRRARLLYTGPSQSTGSGRWAEVPLDQRIQHLRSHVHWKLNSVLDRRGA